MVIRPVDIKSEADILALSNIWRVCFTGDLSYIDSFINSCLSYTVSWFLLSENKPVSLLSLIPSYALLPLSEDQNEFPKILNIQSTPQIAHSSKLSRGAYIYGVATLPEHRGNSYSRMLLNKALDHSRETGLDYIIVKPAEESLFDFYNKVGFETTLYSNKAVFPLFQHSTNSNPAIHNLEDSSSLDRAPFFFDKADLLNIVGSSIPVVPKEALSHFIPLSAEQLFVLREQYNPSSFLWPPEILAYAVIEALSRPNAIAAIDNDLYLIAYPSDTDSRVINILETNANTSAQFCQILTYLQELYPEATAVTTYSANNCFAKQTRCALLKTLSSDRDITTTLSRLYLSLPME
jgi:Acetyltransferases